MLRALLLPTWVHPGFPHRFCALALFCCSIEPRPALFRSLLLCRVRFQSLASGAAAAFCSVVYRLPCHGTGFLSLSCLLLFPLMGVLLLAPACWLLRCQSRLRATLSFFVTSACFVIRFLLLPVGFAALSSDPLFFSRLAFRSPCLSRLCPFGVCFSPSICARSFLGYKVLPRAGVVLAFRRFW